MAQQTAIFAAATYGVLAFACGTQVAGQSACDCAPQTIEVEYGRPRALVDGAGWVVGIPRKLLLWDRRVDNHDVSRDTVRAITDYLAHRGCPSVKVRVNQYDPCGEWRRLVSNRRVGPGWRYSLGVLRHLRYTLLPGRLFGGDEYNPYTDTLSLYSDASAIGLAEAAYAHDVHGRNHPGFYTASQSLPLVAMWHESLATNEVLTYVAIHGDAAQIAETRRLLYARYGLVLGGELGSVLPDGSTIFQVVGAVTGHAIALRENKTAR